MEEGFTTELGGPPALLPNALIFNPPSVVIPADPANLPLPITLDPGFVQPGAPLDAPVELQLTGFGRFSDSFGGMSAEDLQRSLRSPAFADELDRMREQVREEFSLDRSVTISVAGLSVGLSVLYVLWLVRGGVLLSSYLSALPAWRLLDPLPVLAPPQEDDEDDDESLDRQANRPLDPLRSGG